MAVGCLIAAILILMGFGFYCIYKQVKAPTLEESFPWFLGAMASGCALIIIGVLF